MNRAWTTLISALFLLGVAGLGRAQMPGQGGDYFNLGPTGASGMPITGKDAKAAGIGKKAAGIRVEKVEPNTPAFGALEPGDVIMSAMGRPFPAKEDAILVFSRALEAAEALKTPVLKLGILRGGKHRKAVLQVAPLGRHSRSCPVKCKKCASVIHAGLQFLAKAQQGDGSFEIRVGGQNAKVAVTTLAGLAFTASGSGPNHGPYAPNIRKCVAFLLRTAGKESPWKSKMGSGKGNSSQVNWSLGYAPWLLAEAYKATGDQAVLAKIEELVKQILANQEPSGGWAHGPGGPNALNYVELEIVSNFCLTSIGFARRLGVELPQEPIDRAIQYVVDCSGGDGGVGYSTRRGQQGMGDPGRTAGAIVAFHSLGMVKHPFYGKMNSYYRRNMKNLIEGHGSPCMHLFSGALAARLGGPKIWKQYWGLFRDDIMAARCADGSFSARPTKESQQLQHNTDRGEGPAWITAHYLLMMQADRAKWKVLAK